MIKVADSQVSNRWGNILDFKNFDLLLPNEKEARFSLGDQDGSVRTLGTKLIAESKSKNVILKLGDKGIMSFKRKGVHPREFFPLETFARNIIDGIGAGDAMLASSSLAFACTKNLLISSIVGNISAALACEQSGNLAININDIKKRLKLIKESYNY